VQLQEKLTRAVGEYAAWWMKTCHARHFGFGAVNAVIDLVLVDQHPIVMSHKIAELLARPTQV
jgi:hypothetical protein